MTEEQIRHLAKLSEIQLQKEEIEKIKKEFDKLLEFVWKLQSIDTSWIELMYTPIEWVNLDYNRNTNTDIDQKYFLKNSPHEIENSMIVIKSSTVEH